MKICRLLSVTCALGLSVFMASAQNQGPMTQEQKDKQLLEFIDKEVPVVLLQNGKDGGLATNFTSANQTLGVRQTATILEKATWYLVTFILVVSVITVFVGRGATQRGTNDALSTEILNQTEQAADETPAFPISQENPEVAE